MRFCHLRTFGEKIYQTEILNFFPKTHPKRSHKKVPIKQNECFTVTIFLPTAAARAGDECIPLFQWDAVFIVYIQLTRHTCQGQGHP